MKKLLTLLTILLALNSHSMNVKASNATICGLFLSITQDDIGSEGEAFNVTLGFQNVTYKTNITLTPDWDRLKISDYEFVITEDIVMDLNMTASHFYLFNLNLTCHNENSWESHVFEVPVGRTTTESLIAVIFQRVMSIFLALAMLLMGCELKFDVVRAYLRRPLAPIAGMFCQYVCMPVMAYLIGLGMLEDKIMARYGLILVGSSPGGSFSNFWTALWGGDLNLSVTMTFCSTVASFATTTFWVWLFGRFVLNTDKNISLPYLQLFISLVLLVVPVFFGLLITWKRPSWSAKLIKLSRPLFIFMMVLVSSLGVYTNRFFFTVISWHDFVSSACLGFSGYAFGTIFSLLLCLNRQQIIALSLETAIQNAGIAIMILQTNLPSPYGDMALMPVIGYLITSSGLLNTVLFAIFKFVTFIRSCLQSPEDNNEKKDLSLKNKTNQGYMSD